MRFKFLTGHRIHSQTCPLFRVSPSRRNLAARSRNKGLQRLLHTTFSQAGLHRVQASRADAVRRRIRNHRGRERQRADALINPPGWTTSGAITPIPTPLQAPARNRSNQSAGAGALCCSARQQAWDNPHPRCTDYPTWTCGRWLGNADVRRHFHDALIRLPLSLGITTTGDLFVCESEDNFLQRIH